MHQKVTVLNCCTFFYQILQSILGPVDKILQNNSILSLHFKERVTVLFCQKLQCNAFQKKSVYWKAHCTALQQTNLTARRKNYTVQQKNESQCRKRCTAVHCSCFDRSVVQRVKKAAQVTDFGEQVGTRIIIIIINIIINSSRSRSIVIIIII